ncbi:MAG: hypothetical protein V9H26_04565 [Verrucomicrobiota bacterium]
MSENANARWLADRVAYLRQLKAPSEPQRLLMMLAEKPDRSPADDRHLAVLVRAEKADERFAKLRGLAAKVVSEEKAAARKARNHRLIQQGLLFDLVGLESRDPAELAGALAALRHRTAVRR